MNDPSQITDHPTIDEASREAAAELRGVLKRAAKALEQCPYGQVALLIRELQDEVDGGGHIGLIAGREVTTWCSECGVPIFEADDHTWFEDEEGGICTACRPLNEDAEGEADD